MLRELGRREESKAHMDSWQQDAMAVDTAHLFAGLDHAPEHVHVEALAGHQLAQESNLLQAAANDLKATWRWRSCR